MARLIQIKGGRARRWQIAPYPASGAPMIICSCHTVSDHEVRDVVETPDAPLTVSQIYRELERKPKCGRCAHSIRKIMKERRPARL